MIKVDATEYIRKTNVEYDKDSIINWSCYKNLVLDEYLVPKSISKKFVKIKDKERVIREFINYYGFTNNYSFFNLNGTNRNIYESLCYGLKDKNFFIFTGVFCNRISWNEFKTKINKRSSMVYFEKVGVGDGYKNRFITKKPFYPTSLKVSTENMYVFSYPIDNNTFEMEYTPHNGEDVYVTYRSSEGMNFEINDRDYIDTINTVYSNILSINDKISKTNIIFEKRDMLKSFIDRMYSFLSDEEISILYMNCIENIDIEEIAYILKIEKDTARKKYERIIDKIFLQDNIQILEYNNSKHICVLFLSRIEIKHPKIAKILDEDYQCIKKIFQRKRDK